MSAARQARRGALARYSGFAVGAALETTSGVVVTGCNVECASYGLSMCAERVALFTALAAGHRRFRRIAVVADAPDATPCGACRQLLWEYAGDLDVVVANLRRTTGRYTLGELLPAAFELRRGSSGRTD